MRSLVYFVFRFGLISAAALLTFVIFAHSIEQNCFYYQSWVRQRIAESYGRMSQRMKDPAAFVLLIGGSSFESGVDPTEIEAAIHPHINVYNLGVRASPPALPTLSQHLERELKIAGRAADITIVKLDVGYLTKRASQDQRLQALTQEIGASLYSWRQFIQDFSYVPRHSLQLLIERFILDGRQLNESSYYLSELLGGSPNAFCPGVFENVDDLARLLRDPVFFSTPAWDESTHGSYFWNLPNSQNKFVPLIAQLQSREILRHEREVWNDVFGIRDLELDTNQVSRFIESIQMLKQVSHQVMGIYFDDHPDLVMSETGRQHLNEFLAHLKIVTGLEFINLSDPHASLARRLTNDDYLTFGHLNQNGRYKLSLAIADMIKGVNP
jgi:hypothetical protein